MAVPTRYILHQGPVLGALARGAVSTLRKRNGSGSEPVSTPGPELRSVVSPRPVALVRDYARHVGGDPGAYRGRVPPHFFPQWVFPLFARTLEGVHYPMQKVMNAGCRIEVRSSIPVDEPLHVTARLENIDDDGRRAIIHHRAVTSTSTHPEALVSHLYALVPLPGGGKNKGSKSKEKPRVPQHVREVAFWKIGAKSGLEFAKLTGDFNPVHWVPAYARAFGFRNCILHGFSTMARAIEGLNRGLFAGDTQAITAFEARFTRPLVLPARVGLYVGKPEQGSVATPVYVGDAPGGPAYLVGSFETD